jgi:uncharacterized protein (DUF2249 family)
LLAELSMEIEAVTSSALRGADRQHAWEQLVSFCIGRVPAYLAARDRVVYARAAAAAGPRLLVGGLRAQQELIIGYVAELRRAGRPTEITAAAHAVLATLTACREAERAVLWPELARLPELNLPGMLADFDAVLHRGTPAELDLRKIPHGKRHSRVLQACVRLAVGESLMFVDNHAPNLLQLAVKASYPGQFAWAAVENGPHRWRVRITRTRAGSPGEPPRRTAADGG